MDQNLQLALDLDQQDPLKDYRQQFYIPQMNGEDVVYLTGNSLGLQPKITASYIQQELEDWKNLGVEGHFHAKNPWMPYHEFLTDAMASVVGAKPNEVVVMNTLTVNIHLLMATFYRPTAQRYKIVIESDAFPSDRYAVATQLQHHHISVEDGMIMLSPRDGETTLRYEDIEAEVKKHGDTVALILLGGVNYYTGQAFDIKRIAALGHSVGAFVGIDMAHMAGNIDVQLHESNVDFAAWCTYKYLNSGPGSVGGVFVHEKHATNTNLHRLGGWWGHNKVTRFNMRYDFDPIPTAEGWQMSNPPILSLAAIRASLSIFQEVGMPALREKSVKLTNFLIQLLQDVNSNRIKIITPLAEEDRGAQVSISVANADKNLFNLLTSKGVISDWREPDVIRVAPVPLYNSYADVYHFVHRLKECL